MPFSSASAIAVLSFAALGGFLFLNTLYLQEVRGLSALDAGLYTLPIAAMTLIFAPLSGRIVGRRGPRIGLVVGGIGIALAGALMSGITRTTPLDSLLPAYLIFGIGFGMINPPITNTAVLGMPAEQAGVAAAIASTSRQVGQTLGVAIIGADRRRARAAPSGPGSSSASRHRLVDHRRLRRRSARARDREHEPPGARERSQGRRGPRLPGARRSAGAGRRASARLTLGLSSCSARSAIGTLFIRRFAARAPPAGPPGRPAIP